MDWYPLKGDGRTLWGKSFFEDEALDRELASISGALWRAEQGRRILALPYAPDRPFPLTALFCFAKPVCICGKEYVIYCLDANGRPIL